VRSIHLDGGELRVRSVEFQLGKGEEVSGTVYTTGERYRGVRKREGGCQQSWGGRKNRGRFLTGFKAAKNCSQKAPEGVFGQWYIKPRKKELQHRGKGLQREAGPPESSTHNKDTNHESKKREKNTTRREPKDDLINRRVWIRNR